MAKNRTISHKLLAANLVADSIKSDTSSYYMFAAKHTPYTNGVVEFPYDTEEYKNQLYFDMIFGKRIENGDVSYLIDRKDWSYNKSFDQYDDSDVLLSTKDYYAIVNAESEYYVYKCLYNAGGEPSTVEPDFSSIGSNTEYYETSDGYVWKFMYSVNTSIVDKFATSTKFPIIGNSDVSLAATAGTINLIKVESPGRGYDNYLSGDNAFTTNDMRLNGNNLLYDISANSFASSANDFYNGCFIYIKAGTNPEIGQFKKIVDYSVNSTSRTIVLDSEFTTELTTLARYDIYPGVVISGDGNQTTEAIARAVISPFGNTVEKIEMLNLGAGYIKASANVYVYPTVDASGVDLRVISSPSGGHGYNQYLELGAKSLLVATTFGNTQNDHILDSNDYRIVGILKDPIYREVTVQKKSGTGIFLNDEPVKDISPILIAKNVNISATNTSFTSADGDFINQFDVGDVMYFSTANNSNHMLAQVQSITNSSHATLTSNSLFTSSTARLHISKVNGTSIAVTSNATHLVLANVEPTIVTNSLLIGEFSGGMVVANNISISGDVKDFSSFINTYKYLGEVISGSFSEDSVIYQSTISFANAIVHSTSVNGSNVAIYATNQIGKFVPMRNIYEANTGAYSSTEVVYPPELIHRSGEIIYMETLEPITRLPNQSETFKLILEF